MSQVTYVSNAEYRKLLAAQKNNMHVNNKSDMVTSCSKTCIDSHNKLKNLCDKQKNQLGVYEVEIVAYKEDVKKLEGQVVAYQKQQLSYEEKLKLQANDLYDKKLQIEKYKKTTEKALKEKEELKTRLESFDTSSKSLNTMHNSQLIAKDKAGFGHDGVKESKLRDVEVNPFKDVLVFWKMIEFLGVIPINLKGNMWELENLVENNIDWNRPPKEGDGAWHIRIELIDPDGEKFDRAFQSILTTRKLSLKENPSDILNLDHFHDS
ncbi:hypothetical protein Tco_1211428 [Tanacetum coccineum]